MTALQIDPDLWEDIYTPKRKPKSIFEGFEWYVYQCPTGYMPCLYDPAQRERDPYVLLYGTVGARVSDMQAIDDALKAIKGARSFNDWTVSVVEKPLQVADKRLVHRWFDREGHGPYFYMRVPAPIFRASWQQPIKRLRMINTDDRKDLVVPTSLRRAYAKGYACVNVPRHGSATMWMPWPDAVRYGVEATNRSLGNQNQGLYLLSDRPSIFVDDQEELIFLYDMER